MDDPNRPRRQQHDPNIQGTQDPRYPLHPSQQQQQQQQQQHRQTLLGSSGDRFRPTLVNPGGTASRSLGSTSNYPGYYPEPGAAFSGAISQSTLPYPSDYSQDTRQTPSFGGYSANVIYGVPQTGGQYDDNLFTARQPTNTAPIIPSDVPNPYPSFGAGSTTAGAATSTLPTQSHSASTGVAAAYQQAQLSGFHSNIPSVPTMQAATSTDVSMEEAEYPPGAPNPLEERWTEYQSRLRSVYRDIQDGALDQAREALLAVSGWILSQVVDLGLHLDNPDLWPDRIRLWDNFNNAWLALLQRQHDMMGSGQELERGQSLISHENLEKMGSELVRLCDSIERHGLVDYHYGVWEEQITAALIDCCNQYEPDQEGDETPVAGASGR